MVQEGLEVHQWVPALLCDSALLVSPWLALLLFSAASLGWILRYFATLLLASPEILQSGILAISEALVPLFGLAQVMEGNVCPLVIREQVHSGRHRL